TEYKLFSRTLSHKKLTYDQLKYLHNSVLLPKIEFRLKGLLLSDQDCNRIQSAFRRTFKHSLGITLNIPNSFLECNLTLGVFNLYHRLVTGHSNRLYSILQLDRSNLLFSLLSHRLFDIRKSLFLPHPLLNTPNFSSLLKCKDICNDLIFRTVAFASEFGV